MANKKEKCAVCGKLKKCQPFGPDKDNVCSDCITDITEREKNAELQQSETGLSPEDEQKEDLVETGKCSVCGEEKEVQPLGSNKENICLECGVELLKKSEDMVKALTPAPISRSEFVVVCSALPSGQLFNLEAGRKLQINGRKESRFVGENSMPLSGNQYGVTKGVKRSDWEYVMETVGGKNGCKFLKNETMFACSEAQFEDRMKDNKNLRTGFEQVNVENTRTTPAKKEGVN